MSAMPEEEVWEAEIGSLLAGLPSVEPPAGFIDSALDHRPLYAGRILGGLLAVSLITLFAVVATDAAGRSRISPQLDVLAQRHDNVVRAGILATPVAEVDYRVETGVAMPDGFERKLNMEAEEIRQAVYARNDEAVSVFVQPGRLHWDSLDPDGLTEIDGLPAWVDENRQATVVEASSNIVTIMGLSTDQVAEVIETVPRSGPTVSDRLHNTVSAITGQLGFPDLR